MLALLTCICMHARLLARPTNLQLCVELPPAALYRHPQLLPLSTACIELLHLRVRQRQEGLVHRRNLEQEVGGRRRTIGCIACRRLHRRGARGVGVPGWEALASSRAAPRSACRASWACIAASKQSAKRQLGQGRIACRACRSAERILRGNPNGNTANSRERVRVPLAPAPPGWNAVARISAHRPLRLQTQLHLLRARCPVVLLPWSGPGLQPWQRRWSLGAAARGLPAACGRSPATPTPPPTCSNRRLRRRCAAVPLRAAASAAVLRRCQLCRFALLVPQAADQGGAMPAVGGRRQAGQPGHSTQRH